MSGWVLSCHQFGSLDENSTMKTLPIIALGVINTKGLVTNYGEGEGHAKFYPPPPL